MSDDNSHPFAGLAQWHPGIEPEIATLRAAARALYSAYHKVHSAYDGECEHGFGPPATECPNNSCPDRDLAVAWRELLSA